MSEIALVSSRKIRLENAAKKGSKQAKEALKLINSPGKFLSTVQIGITLIGILTGIYSGDKITTQLQLKLTPWLGEYADTAAVVVVLVILTFFSLVLGELVPKRIGLSNPEGISKAMARPMRWLSIGVAPFVWLLSFTTDMIMKIIPVKNAGDDAMIEDEIKAIVQEGAHRGEVEEIEQDIVTRVFSLGDRKVGSLMTHRTDLMMIHVDDTPEIILGKIKTEMHSNYPVYDDRKKYLVGVIHLKDIVFEITKPGFQLKPYIQKPNYIPENVSSYDALQLFKKKKINFAVVTDEFGHLEGVLSLNDILEALAGNADDFDYDEPAILLRDDGTWLVDGQYSFADFLHYFDMEDMIGDYDFNTVGGLILDELKNIPRVGEKIKWAGFEFEVMDMDGARIDKVLVSRSN